MNWNNPYFTELDKIELLQRWILFQSVCYYDYDDTIVEDKVYDDNVKQLLRLMKQNKNILSQSKYSNLFEDFDGSTGFHFVKKLQNENLELYNELCEVIEKKLSKN